MQLDARMLPPPLILGVDIGRGADRNSYVVGEKRAGGLMVILHATDNQEDLLRWLSERNATLT